MKARWNTRLECLIQGLCVRREEYIRERERERERERGRETTKITMVITVTKVATSIGCLFQMKEMTWPTYPVTFSPQTN